MKRSLISRAMTGALVIGAVAMTHASIAAAATFPTKSVTMIVGYRAGGGTDTLARAAADPISKMLGQSVLVQNKAGAGGGVAALYTSKTPPDGYTFVVTTSTTYTLEPQLQKVAYKNDDLTHIAVIGQFQEAIFTKAGAPFKTLQDMIAYAKKEKRALKYASFYQLDRLVTGYIADREGIKMIPVPVKGGAGVMPAVLGGHVDFGWSGGSFAPHARAGTITMLGAMTYDRLGQFPDLPSMKDFGYPTGTQVFITVSAAAGTPKPVVDKLADAWKQAMQDKVVVDIMEKRNQLIVFHGPDEMPALLANQTKMYADMVKLLKKK
jgi:tripartite-type tricarboxylate transporter receptor subunit TctC